MDDNQKIELQELQNLEGSGALEEAMKPRYEELKGIAKLAQTVEDFQKESKSALAQKDHFREKFEKEQKERLALEAKLNSPETRTANLPIEDFISVSAALDGLDGREKEYLAQQHTLTKKPLSEIRQSEDFNLWKSAYQQKVEKDKQSLPPSSRQPEEDKPMSIEDALAGASLEDKEKILEENFPDYRVSSPKSRHEKVIRR